MQTEQPQPKHHERECGAVVQAAFAGQGKAQFIAVARLLHLHIGCQHRISGSQDAAQQYCGAQRQAYQQMTNRGDGKDRDEHRRRCQPQGQQPAPFRQAMTELEAGREQRHQHHDFGQAFDKHRVPLRVDRQHAEAQRSDRDAHPEVEHRRRQRQPRQHCRAQRHDNQQPTNNHRPDRKFHNCHCWS